MSKALRGTRLNGRLRNLRLTLTQKELLLLVVCYVLRVYIALFLLFFGFGSMRSQPKKGLCGRLGRNAAVHTFGDECPSLDKPKKA